MKQTHNTMETKEIAIAIRENLFKEMELVLKYAAKERELMDKAFKAEDTEEIEKFAKLAQAEEREVNLHTDNVRQLRYALHSLLTILRIDFDSFHPELAEIELA